MREIAPSQIQSTNQLPVAFKERREGRQKQRILPQERQHNTG